jgi:hypothetical protein
VLTCCVRWCQATRQCACLAAECHAHLAEHREWWDATDQHEDKVIRDLCHSILGLENDLLILELADLRINNHVDLVCLDEVVSLPTGAPRRPRLNLPSPGHALSFFLSLA